MTRPLLAVVVAIAALYLFICALMFVFQRSLIYFPQARHAGDRVPSLSLESEGESLKVSTRALSQPDAVLYFGGNAEDVSSSIEKLAAAFPDQALYLMHYRGFGGSTGRPSEAGFVADARALYDHVAPAHRSLTVVGRSLGSGVAIQLAVSRPVARLVMITPYNSLLELASDLYPWLPVRWLLKDRYESYRYASQVTVPTRLIVAERDVIVPIPSSEALSRQFAPGIVTRVKIPGSDHVTILDAPDFVTSMTNPGERP